MIIGGDGSPFGVLEVDSTRLRSFEEDDISFLQGAANLVASAIDRLAAQARLERALEDKQVLLHELQHRVKNSLQEIGALVGMERRKLADPVGSTPARRAGGQDRGARQWSIASCIFPTIIPRSSSPPIWPSSSASSSCFIGIDHNAIRHELQLTTLLVDLDHALPLGLIVCEFIVNSFKHAFPEGRGCIRLDLEPVGPERARLTLADDGVGLPAPGNQSSGSGLRLIERLVAQIDGELEFRGEGSVSMTIVFPLGRKATHENMTE